jgi:integrase
MALAVVRRVLNLASSEWMDRQGKTWLEAAPKIKLFPVKDARSPYPLTREEQALLFRELPLHLSHMALFKVNTGLREQEVCGLKWEYEVKVPELDTSVFIIPGEQIKNGEERLVVLNRVAKSVVESVRGLNPVNVFVRPDGLLAAAPLRSGPSPPKRRRPTRRGAGLSNRSCCLSGVRIENYRAAFGRSAVLKRKSVVRPERFELPTPLVRSRNDDFIGS